MTRVTPTSITLTSQPIPDHWNTLVPEYRSRVYPSLVIKMNWDSKYAEEIRRISEKRASNRITNYLSGDEITRVAIKLKSKKEASIRFGVSKGGHGYNGERGDFCLVGGVIRGKDLTVFYRSLELIGGFAYDLCLMDFLGRSLKTRWRFVTIMATKANVFALKGNSNEKLYPKLKKIFHAES